MSLPQDRRLQRQTLLVFTAALCAMLGITCWFLYSSWTDREQAKVAELAETSQIVRVAVQDHLNGYAQDMGLLAAQIRDRGWLQRPDALLMALQNLRATEPALTQLAVLSPDGHVLADTGVASSGAIPGLAALQPQLRSRGGALLLSRAVRRDASGELVIPLGWASHAAGEPEFWLVGALDLQRENTLQAKLLGGRDDPRLVLKVIDDQGYGFGRWPLPARGADAVFLHPLGDAQSLAPRQADREPMLSARQHLQDYPLSAVVELPRRAVIEAWWRQVRVPLATALLLALLMVVMMARELGLQRVWLRHMRTLLDGSERAREAQRKDANLFMQMLDELPAGIIVFNPVGQVQYCSAGFARLTGLAVAPRELIGKPWHAVWSLIGDLHAGGASALEQVKLLFREHQPAVDEVWIRDGRVFLRHYTPLFERGGEGAAPRSAGALWSVQDVTAHKLQEQRIRELAERDALTGLINRGAFEALLGQALQHDRDGLALGIIDLDDFKSVNDRFGHAAGDALLVEAARRLRGALRLSEHSRKSRGVDILARIGGDEFAILLPNIRDARGLHCVADRVMAALREPIEIDGQQLAARLSLGLAIRSHGEDGQTLMRQADIALYAAKAAGRNQACVFDQTMQAALDARQGWITAVETALAEQRLELYMQPILSAPRTPDAAPRVSHVEALLRLRDEAGKVHAAGAFEHVLDDARLAMPIGRWVLEQAAAWVEQWKSSAGLDLCISVNISPRHFLSSGFVGDVGAVLRRHQGLAPSALVLELTEHGALLDSDATRERIEQCRALGVQISLDDFGTGSASLIHLQALAVSTLKIERRFVKDLLHDPRDLSISYGILRTAQLMGVRVVAEGVETQELARVLVAMGCEQLQGYGIARPMPAAEVPEWVRRLDALVPWSRGLGQTRALAADGIEAIVSLGTMQRQLLQGGLDEGASELLRSHDAHLRCPVGVWCERHAGRWQHRPGFQDLLQRHEELHAVARRWLEQPEAREGLLGELQSASDDVRKQFWALTLREDESALSPA